MLITIVLTYRDRDLELLENCLNSLRNQTNVNFKVTLVDYGSTGKFKNRLTELVSDFPFVSFIKCKTYQQLWCKSRAVNIALKQCETPYVFVGDIDMVFHPEFMDYLDDLKNEKIATYFQVGFLSELESKTTKDFEDYNIKFKSSSEATGMTLYNTEVLKSINGYDEFYNGWGAEDTDVHVRLLNAGYSLNFYDDKILMLHQWHDKLHRTNKSIAPYHSSLEKINYQYLKFSKESKKVKANTNFSWGVYNELDYLSLDKIDKTFELTNKESEVKAFISNVLLVDKNIVVKVIINKDQDGKSLKQKAKKLLGKKKIKLLKMKTLNNLLLETIILNLRNQPYRFQFNTKKQTISLIIKL